MGRILAIGVAVVAMLAVVGIVWVANAHVMPPTQKVEQTIPDDRIPR